MHATLFPTEQDTRSHHPPHLRTYQRIGADWLADRKRGLIADVMGLGKTCQAITAALSIRADRVLIVAPLATALGWQREVALWGGPEVTILRRKHETPSGAGWYFAPWTDLAHRLPSLMAAGSWDVVIYDEVHRAKAGSRTQTGEAAWGKWSKDRTTGGWKRKPGLVDRAERLWCLTGTPMPNGRPAEAYAMLNALGCSVARSRQKYVERYCARPNSFAPRGYDELGALNLPELNRYMAEVMLRRTPETVPGELPELLRVNVPLEGQDVEHGNVQVEVDDYGRVTVTSDGLPAFEEMARYRAEMGRAKVPAVAEWVKDYVTDGGDEKRPLVVFTHHKDVARGIAEALPAGWAIVATGDDQPDVRQGKVDQFARADGPLVFIGTAPACGTGMNGLHKRTNVCAFAEGEWSPADLDQAEGRIRRIGSVAGDAIAHYLLVADSLEEHIMLTINEKREHIREGVDGEATERAALVTPAAPKPAPAPAPAPAPEPQPVPEPQGVEWSFGRDQSGDWCARANHRGDASWQGADVTLVTRDGREKAVVLGACARAGADWSLWRFSTRIDSGGAAKRGAGRGIAGATDASPCSAADQPAILACIAAAERLCQLDPDRALEQNGVGWRSGDHTMGAMLRDIPADAWTQGTLATARGLLGIYSKTQIVDLWPTIKGK
jgi:hypothetical protein